MFDATLLDSSPERVPVLDGRHWVGAFGVGVLGGLAGYLLLPLMFSPAPEARMVESLLLGVGVMFYELMLWYVLADARQLGLNSGSWSIVLLVLNVVGFVVYLIYSAAKSGEWKRATLPLAYVFQGIVVCALLLFPLISTQALPDAQRFADLLIPAPPAGPRPVSTSRVKTAKHPPAHSVIEAPPRFPVAMDRVIEKPDPTRIAPSNYPSVMGGIDPGPGGPGNNPGLIILLGEGRVPPPPVTPHSAKVNRVQIGGRVEEAKLIFHPSPPYPELPKLARIQGTVVLEAIISRDGTIQGLKAISGHPLLIPAALEAVRRWRYQPTLLNGEPVEVVTDITVNFILSEQ
ncbi:MAG TPA: TonB family protein [Terriglobia bacterium]|nr:TonB family protein [Terriglobia bacterium]